MTGRDIVQRATQYLKGYAYWYGGKGQKCTEELLKELSALYPQIYTPTYQKKCKADISAGRRCVDCSGLVCKAYGIGDIGTYQMATDKRFHVYNGTPRDGMIVWKWTHVGIYSAGKVIEARGKDYGVTASRTYRPGDWQRVYIVDGVEYNMQSAQKTQKTAREYLLEAVNVIDGKRGNGAARNATVNSLGYNADIVQQLVNLATKGAKS